MKLCPQCSRTYADETLSFCLVDGAILSAPYDPEERRAAPPVPAAVAPQAGRAEPPPAPRGRGLNFGYVVILLLAVLVSGSAVALLYERGKGGSVSDAGPPLTQPSTPPAAERPRAGPAPLVKTQARFSVTPCNSIRDGQTGLEWFVGPDRNVTWYEAREWVNSLRDCGDGWRMPASNEIGTLYNPALQAGSGYYTGGKSYPAHIDPVFEAIGGGSWVWADDIDGDEAQSFNLNQGKAVRYSATDTLYSTRAFAVRNVRN